MLVLFSHLKQSDLLLPIDKWCKKNHWIINKLKESLVCILWIILFFQFLYSVSVRNCLFVSVWSKKKNLLYFNACILTEGLECRTFGMTCVDYFQTD